MKEVCYNKLLYNYIESTLIRNKIVADEDSFLIFSIERNNRFRADWILIFIIQVSQVNEIC